MKIKLRRTAEWVQHPIYTVYTFKDYEEIKRWMRANGVEHFLLSSGFNGYTFQVKHNHEWFALRWS